MVVEAFSTTDLMQKYCKETRQWGIMLVHHWDWEDDTNEYITGNFFEDLKLAAPDLDRHDVIDETAFFFSPHPEDILKIYNRTVGDEGGEDNDYKGPVRVYALTCDNEGNLRNENT